MKALIIKKRGRSDRLIARAIELGMKFDGVNVVSYTGRALLPYRIRNGYFGLNLSVEGEKARVSLGRVICWIAHGPPPHISYDADHENRNKSDNAPRNLRWLTHKANIENMSAEARANINLAHTGERNACARLTESEVIELRKMWDGGATITALRQRFQIGEATAFNAASGISWKHLPLAVRVSRQYTAHGRENNVAAFGH